ncbi:aldo-keto reductase family 1 member A1-A-like [Panonychus citri]|uniref:aldo-keto reductase family 1 member A1-A-like n=1 Tax=Panonychus citri TaxID=50023 RepID=UPI00230703F1|nr:aldo-keto reductase family 1 member A1-A-like [Panonychus citri]
MNQLQLKYYDYPYLGLGTWRSDKGKVKEAVKFALLEANYRHIDCALLYNNEEEVGQALAEVFETGRLTRADVFITTKCWNTYHSRDKVTECCKKSLANLGLDYVDLYLIHWPTGFKEGDDPFPLDSSGKVLYSDVDYLETWKGMEDVQKAGLSKSIGVSNFNSEQIQRVLDNCEVKPVMNQIEVHPYLSQQPLINFCKQRGIDITAYSPLGSPDRPGANPSESGILADSTIINIAKVHNKTPAQILLRYAVQRDIIVIPKSVTPNRIKENSKIFDFDLTNDEMRLIANLNQDKRYITAESLKDHPYFPFAIPY